MSKQPPAIKNLQIIHFSLCIGVLAVGAVLGEFPNEGWGFELDLQGKGLIVLFFPVLAIVLGQFLFSRTTQGANQLETFELQLALFQKAHIIRMALLEASALAIVVLTNFSGDTIALILYLLVLVRMILLFPTKQRVLHELKVEL
jgi:hypothetical protein